MNIHIWLFSMVEVKAHKTGMIFVGATVGDEEPNHIHEIEAQNTTTDFAALRFIEQANYDWNNELPVCVRLTPDTFNSDENFEKWRVEAKKTHQLLNGRLLVLVQSTVDREWFRIKATELNDLRVNGLEIGLEVVGGMDDASDWQEEFDWNATQLNLGKCRSEFSKFVVYTSQMYGKDIKNMVIDVHDRSELITIEQVYADYASGPVFGNACIWNGPLSQLN